jgi:hypothetical protein
MTISKYLIDVQKFSFASPRLGCFPSLLEAILEARIWERLSMHDDCQERINSTSRLPAAISFVVPTQGH